MKIFIVKLIEDDLVCGAFTTKEKAEKAIEIMWEQDDIFEGNHYYTKEEWRNFFYIDDYFLDKIYDNGV